MKLGLSAVVLAATVIALAATAMAGPGRWNCNNRNTAGWQLMTAEERVEHQKKMRGFTSYSSCQGYVADHHRMMEERAKEKGLAKPMMRHNPCDTMKAKGWVK